MQHGVDEIGTDFAQRFEDKPTLMQSRVWGDDLFGMQHLLSVIEDVQVDGARGISPAFRMTHTTQYSFNIKQFRHQCVGFQSRFQHYQAIQKPFF